MYVFPSFVQPPTTPSSLASTRTGRDVREKNYRATIAIKSNVETSSMPAHHGKRSQKGISHQKDRYRNYEQNKPRYTVAPTFTAKSISAVNIHYDGSLEMKHYRKAQGKCTFCGSTENLHVHHIDKNHGNNTTENLMVLCASCHKKLHLELDKCPTVTEEARKN